MNKVNVLTILENTTTGRFHPYLVVPKKLVHCFSDVKDNEYSMGARNSEGFETFEEAVRDAGGVFIRVINPKTFLDGKTEGMKTEKALKREYVLTWDKEEIDTDIEFRVDARTFKVSIAA